MNTRLLHEFMDSAFIILVLFLACCVLFCHFCHVGFVLTILEVEFSGKYYDFLEAIFFENCKINQSMKQQYSSTQEQPYILKYLSDLQIKCLALPGITCYSTIINYLSCYILKSQYHRLKGLISSLLIISGSCRKQIYIEKKISKN